MYLGIEIGGTKLQLGLGQGDERLAGLWRGSVDLEAGGSGIRAKILQTVPELLRDCGIKSSEVNGIGIGFGGPVDDVQGCIIKSHQVHGWDNFALVDWAKTALGWPCVIGNDADVAGLAESLFGAGKGANPVFYVTVGSGIGGGLIIDRQIYRAVGQGAAEIGHLRLGPNGEILEDLASGWAISRFARAHGADAPILKRMAGNDLNQLTTQMVAQAASEGDHVARESLDRATSALARGLCMVIALVCPERIVIGGGVSLIGDELFFQPIRAKVAELVFKPFAHCTEIVPAALGEDMVVLGALAMAKRRFGGSS